MRSSKYHDYRVLKVIAFIVLVVLGLFIYVKCIKAPTEHIADSEWVVEKAATCDSQGLKYQVCSDCGKRFNDTVIPALEHVAGNKVNENVDKATCTVGGSHDEVVYCTLCDIELSRETVQDAVLGHSKQVVKENVVPSTHATEGSYDEVTCCARCDEVFGSESKVIAPIGHNYTDLSVEYSKEIGSVIIIACCPGCEEDGNIIHLTGDDANVTLSSERDERYAPCCNNDHTVKASFKYTFEGKSYTEEITTVVSYPLESHKLFEAKVEDINGNLTDGYIPIRQFAHYDANGNIYYDLADEVIREHISITEDAVWSDSGFSQGYFRCIQCEETNCAECTGENDAFTWFAVRVYSADKVKTEE